MRRFTATLLASLLLAAGSACSPDSGAATATGSGSGDDGGGGSDGGGSPGAGGDSSSPSSSGNGAGGPSSSNSGSSNSGAGAGAPCAEGTIVCEGTTKQVCDGQGGFTDVQLCDPGVCIPAVGCTVCSPGSGTCAGNVSTVCNEDGSGFDTYVCDPEQGVTCNAGTGHCDGACAPEDLGTSYIGCDYFPTVTLNTELQNRSFPVFSGEGTYAVAVANTSNDVAAVKVHRGPNLVVNTSVAAGSVEIIALPWVYDLKNATSSQLLVDGAYRLRTNRPVTVYQYNPIEYETPNGNTYTNDASVLLPANAWTGTYRVAARNSWRDNSGFYSVTASQDGTTVTVTPSVTGSQVVQGGGIAANGTGAVVLNEGDVLQVLSASNGDDTQSTDLTGTLIAADKPVQVIGGHDCTFVPSTTGFCDHLEESMPPVETLANDFIVTPPLTAASVVDAQFIRIIATQPATNLTYDPPQAGAPTALANAGDWAEIPATTADFLISGDKPILVAQYMRGNGESELPGDPAMALAVATEQYRGQYLFHAPTNYDANFVNVTAPPEAVITLDGVAVTGFVPIGGSGFSVARVPLESAGDGNHVITGDEPFGISVYGYGYDTSYWYPGGLDLDKLGATD
jgi:hypothetical protein